MLNICPNSEVKLQVTLNLDWTTHLFKGSKSIIKYYSQSIGALKFSCKALGREDKLKLVDYMIQGRATYCIMVWYGWYG